MQLRRRNRQPLAMDSLRIGMGVAGAGLAMRGDLDYTRSFLRSATIVGSKDSCRDWLDCDDSVVGTGASFACGRFARTWPRGVVRLPSGSRVRAVSSTLRRPARGLSVLVLT